MCFLSLKLKDVTNDLIFNYMKAVQRELDAKFKHMKNHVIAIIFPLKHQKKKKWRS